MLLEVLVSEGVEYIFGNPGTTELPLMDAVVAMTDGYAQAAGRPGFLNLHTAGGLRIKLTATYSLITDEHRR